ncbi:MAG: AEC family transporter [Hyphomicrobiales bacterium]|nr:AEC family transporter [Hyphomicrobiales bacterium]
MGVGAVAPAFAGVIDLALPFFGLIGLGFVCGRMFDFDEGALAWMNVFIIYVALPSLMFTLVSKTPFSQLLNFRFMLCTVGATMTAFAIAFAIGMRATRDMAQATIQALIGGYANIGYMGPGLTLATLGAASAAPTALIFLADTIFLFSAVPILMAFARGDESGLGRTVLRVAARVLTNPFNLAVFVAVIFAYFSIHLPQPIEKMTVLLSGSAAPAALFTLGVTVALRPIKRIAPELPLLLAVKLVAHPLIVYLYLSLMGGVSQIWVFTAVLMASLPPALNAFVMASQYQAYVERASSAILIGTLVSVVSVTILLWLVTTGVMPASLFAH